jgi:hypothetical protein
LRGGTALGGQGRTAPRIGTIGLIRCHLNTRPCLADLHVRGLGRRLSGSAGLLGRCRCVRPSQRCGRALLLGGAVIPSGRCGDNSGRRRSCCGLVACACALTSPNAPRGMAVCGFGCPLARGLCDVRALPQVGAGLKVVGSQRRSHAKRRIETRQPAREHSYEAGPKDGHAKRRIEPRRPASQPRHQRCLRQQRLHRNPRQR